MVIKEVFKFWVIDWDNLVVGVLDKGNFDTKCINLVTSSIVRRVFKRQVNRRGSVDNVR